MALDLRAREEWTMRWPLPLVAMLGVAGSGLFSFSTGVFMDEMVRAFGWSKTQYTSAMIVPVLMCLVVVPFVGRLIDRVGARRVAVAGVIPATAGLALLGLANGSVAQWWLLCSLQASGTIIILPPVWLKAVVDSFDRSRGLAIAVALAGTGVGTALWPIIAAFYIDLVGWRLAYGCLALTWGMIMFPLTLAFFHDGPAAVSDRAARGTAPPFAHLLLTRTFLCLAIGGGIFICVSFGITLHLVPILRASGLSLKQSAALAGLAGLISILGRLVAGFLLDRFSARALGLWIFLLPVAVSGLLLGAHGSLILSILAVIVLGLAIGAEGDVLTYIASRRFGHAIFGSIYSVLQAVLAMTSVSGSILAGALFDVRGSYTLFLIVVMPLTIIGAACIALLPSSVADKHDVDEQGGISVPA